ncbi:MAG: hypothetical protein K2Y12_05875 [Chitinophagaceae bacterium]|nr:hypothetical protein [Chitinophagaceae bacterium]
MSGRFYNTSAAIITKHGKEKIIGPILWDAFHIHLELAYYDTDLLGTFSGEIERPADQLGTARLKIQQAAAISNANLLLASEGAFHPHPDTPFLTVNTELIILFDRATEQEIIAKHTTLETNAATISTNDEATLLDFAKRIQFPTHRIILIQDNKHNGSKQVLKDMATEAELINAFRSLQKDSKDIVVIETDLRAMHNPTRQDQIKITANKLVQLMRSHCPSCDSPGYQIQNWLPGLPCCWCNTPTKNTQYEQYRCTYCGFEEQKRVSKPCADPGTCDQCNP